jgi:fatty acid-binding protein DegV
MYDYQIITDSGSDLPEVLLRQLNVRQVSLTVNFKGETLNDSVDAGIKDLYEGLRTGHTATTAAVNPDRWATAMKETLEEGKDVLVIAFSSGLSTTYQSAVIAAEELRSLSPSADLRCGFPLRFSGPGPAGVLCLRQAERGHEYRKPCGLAGGKPPAPVPLVYGQ